MNDSWGYNKDDPSYKSSTELIQTLCEIASKGGHLLLNVSPMGDGQLPPEQIQRLNDMAAWMARNHDSIIGTKPGRESWQFYGPSTQKGNTVYLHLLSRPYESVTVRSVHVNKVKSVRVLGSGKSSNTANVSHCSTSPKLAGFTDPVGDMVIAVRVQPLGPMQRLSR
jgi:alpha-L-fucosidase